jgi:hypothetical protein
MSGPVPEKTIGWLWGYLWGVGTALVIATICLMLVSH